MSTNSCENCHCYDSKYTREDFLAPGNHISSVVSVGCWWRDLFSDHTGPAKIYLFMIRCVIISFQRSILAQLPNELTNQLQKAPGVAAKFHVAGGKIISFSTNRVRD